MAREKLTRSDCILLLQEKKAELQQNGEQRYPKRADFSEREVVAIKAFLGPWPRALEAAGIKPPRERSGTSKPDVRSAKADEINSEMRGNEK